MFENILPNSEICISKPVAELDEKKNIVKIWPSIAKAEKYYDFSKNKIPRELAKGKKWRYLTLEELCED